MHDWYVFDEGIEKGPLSEHALIEYVKTRNLARVHVWRQGLDQWVLARDVPDIVRAVRPTPPLVAIRPSELVGADATPTASVPVKKRKGKWAGVGALIGLLLSVANIVAGRSGIHLEQSNAGAVGFIVGYVGAAAFLTALIGFICGTAIDIFTPKQDGAAADIPHAIKAHRYNNIVARHWRGELPLWMSYWVFGFVGNILITLVPALSIAIFRADSGFYPPAIFWALTTTWGGILGILTWQVVGTWRSAAHYTAARIAKGRSTAWATLAQVALVLGLLGVVGSFIRTGLPQIAETYRIAFEGDPDIPSYSIRLMRDGTEAEIVGGFKYGLTDDLEKVLKAARRTKVVHLDSIGGRLGEGERLFKLIRTLGLDTYVSSKCLSACTLAFAGGRQRYLHKGASLGFHRGAFTGIHEGEFDRIQRDVFRAAGIDSRFIDRALSTPHKDMWRPSAEILLAARVITGVTDGTQFAHSGLGADISKQEIGTKLARALPLFEAMRSRFPKQFDALIAEYHDSLMRGRTEAETIDSLRSKLHPFIRSLLPMAADDVLVDYNRIMVDQYTELNAISPTYCYFYASGEGTTANYLANMSAEILQRERAVQERVVKTATKRPQSDPQLVESLWAKVRSRVLAAGLTESNLALLESTKVDKSRHSLYCAVAIAFFREIGRLPQREAAILMRDVFAAR